MPRTDHFKKNRLLSALPPAEWNRWSAALESVDMPLGEVLYEPGVTLKYVYFPVTSIVSLLYVMENGASAEIAMSVLMKPFGMEALASRVKGLLV
jgi:hypothetical protein